MNVRLLGKKPVLVRVALVLIASLFLASSVQAEIVVEHRQGQTRLPQTPVRVVTFDMSSLDTLDALGVDIVGLPKAHIPDSLAKYRDARYAGVGSLFEPDYEALAALQPDLIIIGSRSASSYRQLSRLAPTIDLSIGFDDLFASLEQNVMTLARIFGKEAEARAQLDDIDARLDSLKQQVAGQSGTALIIVSNGGRLSAYGPNSRFGWIHEVAGLQPVDESLRVANHGNPVSFEYLLQKNPDYIFVVDRDAAVDPGRHSARALLDNDLVRQTQAAQNDRIIYLDSVRWYILIASLNATREMIEELSAALQD